MNKKTPRSSKRIGIIISAVAIVLAFAGGWWVYSNFIPHPLGEKMEYLGKEELGGGFIYRDHDPYSVYYYGTDMEAEEVAKYFKGANLQHPIEDQGSYKEIWLSNSAYPNAAKVYFYDSAQASQMPFQKPINKKHVIKTRANNYELLKNSL